MKIIKNAEIDIRLKVNGKEYAMNLRPKFLSDARLSPPLECMAMFKNGTAEPEKAELLCPTTISALCEMIKCSIVRCFIDNATECSDK